MKKRNANAKALERKTFQQQVVPGKKTDRTKYSSDFTTDCPLCFGDGLYCVEASEATCPECGGTGEVEMWR